MDEMHLHQPLLLPLTTPSATNSAANATTTTTTATTATTNFSVALRLLLVLVIAIISTWANHEASKGFVITVTNDINNTHEGEKFSLFFVANDEATRLVQSGFDFATKILYPNANSMPENLIHRVEIQLANPNLTQKTKYVNVIFISPSIMQLRDFRNRIREEIQRGITELLVFNGENRAPKTLLDGMVEYISNLAGFGGSNSKKVFKLMEFREKCWEGNDPKLVAQFLGYCEGKSEGFIGRLNQAIIRNGWDEGVVDRALEMPSKYLCESLYNSIMKNQDFISDFTSTFL